jgi:hypothetical protein
LEDGNEVFVFGFVIANSLAPIQYQPKYDGWHQGCEQSYIVCWLDTPEPHIVGPGKAFECDQAGNGHGCD